MRRFTRLTNAFSKKVGNHAAAIALHTMYYNFVRIHQTLKVTPAMAAGVTDKLWEMEDLVAMLEQWELANFKPEYQFVVRQYAIGKGHSVSVLWRGGEVDISPTPHRSHRQRWSFGKRGIANAKCAKPPLLA